MAKKAIGYIRVSTEKQADGVSLDAQRAKIEAWALLNEYELTAIYNDSGITGSVMDKREGLQQALKDTKKGMALVVYSMSRLSRSLKDTLSISEALNKTGADLVSITEKIDTTGASGRMVFNMLAVLNQFEREQIAERTSNSLQHKKRTGQKYTNKTPYGYEVINNRLEQVASEAKVVAEIMRARHEGKTLGYIARQLNAQGIPTKQGKQWQSATIHYLLKRSPLCSKMS
jgi:site-specific DNA recombinase